MNVVKLSLLVIAALAGTPTSHADCAGEKARLEEQQVAKLIRSIEAKFDLKSNAVSYNCGGQSISFSYVPPVKIVPTVSFFQSFNDSMVLGEIPADRADTISLLEKFFAREKSEITALKSANANFHKDSMQLESIAMIYAYDPSAYSIDRRVNAGLQLLFVTIAHCQPNGGFHSAEPLGTVSVPIFTIEAMLSSGDGTPVYQPGDIAKSIRAKSDVVSNFESFAKDNMTALLQSPRVGKYCSTPMGEENRLVDWNEALQFLVR